MRPFQLHAPRSLAVIAGLAIALSACSEPEGIVGIANAPLGARESQATRQRELVVPERFAIAIRALGRLVPGEVITIEAEVRGIGTNGDAEVTISAPEVAIASSLTPVDRLRVRVGERITPLLRKNLQLSAHVPERLRATLTVREQGYYRVSVSAVAPQRGEGAAAEQSSVHREVWLLIDSAGGRVTQYFEAALVPSQAIAQPGPWRGKQARSSQPVASAGVALYGGDGNDYYQVVYWNHDVSAYVAVPNSRVEYRTYREEYGNPVLMGTEMTATMTNGTVAIPCWTLSAGEWYEGDMRMTNDEVVISNQGLFGWIGGPGGDDCGALRTASNPETIIAPSNQAHVFRNFTLDIDASRTFFTRSRGQLEVKVYNSGSGADYSGFWDDVEIWYENIWGGLGRFTAAHEYGHALHEKGLGGNPASGACPDPHYNDQRTSLACALSEGFATYHAAAIGATYFNLETYDYTYGCNYSGSTCTPGSTRDGSIVEGAVASFFFNLTDPANSPDDPIQYPGVYIADIVHTCWLTTPGWHRVDGVDFATYCHELQVDPDVRQSYFPTRSYSGPMTIGGENAAEPPNWNQADIRSLWRWHLYRNAAPPPPPPNYWANVYGPIEAGPSQICNFSAQTNVPDPQIEWRVNGNTVGTALELSYASASSYVLELVVWNGSGGGANDSHSVTVAPGLACNDM